ncbi:hypothetical protein H1R20_g16336, partial [Candolleomyces eurysporus]
MPWQLPLMLVQIVNLNQRTGLEFLCLAIRKDLKQYNAPYVFQTSDQFDNFFHHTTKYTLTDLALKLEGFFLGSINGLAQNYVERLIQLKSATTALIKEKLINAAGSQVPRMVYINFDQAITLKHAIILKGWPLPQFCCPFHITACSDIELLYNAWKSGAAHFVKLNDSEYKQWQSQYLQQHAATLATGAQANSINPNGQSINSSTLTVKGSANSNAAVTDLPVQAATNAPTVSDAPVLSPAPASFLNFGLDGTMVPNKT